MRCPKIVAHRGASAYRIGNTKEAFDLAIAQGADCIELDVQLTADREIVVYDKWHVQQRAVVESTMAELRDVAGLSTLAEVIEQVRDSSVEMLVELKNSRLLQPPDLARRVAGELRHAGFADRSLVFSFDHALIASMKSDIRKGILYVARLVDLDATLRATGAHFVETRNDFLDQPMIDKLHSDGRFVCGWATDDPAELVRLSELGVDMVTTNAPDVARAALRSGEESTATQHKP